MNLSLEIWESINSVVEMINKTELIRKQIYDLTASLKGEKSAALVITAGDELDKKLIAVEENLFQMKLTGGSQDSFRAPQRLYGRLCVLDGDVSDSSDFSPTTQSVEVYEILKTRLTSYKTELNELLNKDLPAFNNLLKEKNVQNIITIKKP